MPLQPLPPVEPAAFSRRLVRPFTRVELRLVLLISDGLTRPQLAPALGLSPRTVDTYLKIIARKVGDTGDVPLELRGIDRIRFWVQQQRAYALVRRIAALEAELKEKRHSA
ncbi:MAG TPA: hypothetical protein VJS69_01210 [Candidatus Krumholzibacteria bacterium]|nr:hypothetical protein [Candidatus Krumholzibacteria bacterium]